MNIVLTLLPFASCIISFVFAFLVFKRYLARRGPHLLLWGIGMVMYGIGGFCEAFYGVFGWNPLVFRLWYLFGAMLVAAWLGQGTVYLLAKRKWADILMIVLGLASVYGAIRVFGAQLDPAMMGSSLHTGSELSGRAITSGGVRSLTPFFNLYGTDHAGGRRGLLDLDLLAQADPAAPGHRQHLHRRRCAVARVRRHLQPVRHRRRALHQRAARRDPAVHRLHPRNHADGWVQRE